MKATIQGDKIVLTFQYDPVLVSLVRGLPERRYYSDPPRWVVPASPWHAREVVSKLPGFQIDPAIRSLAKEVRTMVQASKKTKGRRISGLYPYQSAAVDFISKANGRCIVADDIGLGKTVETLAWLREAGLERIWVVAPASVVLNWKDEYERWMEETGLEPILSTTGPLSDSMAMSYNIMTRRADELENLPKPDLIVFDEAHYLKGQAKRVARVAKARMLSIGVPHLLHLTATPFPNRPIELYNLLNMLDPKAWGSLRDFGMRYCGGWTPQGWYKGATNLDELHERLQTIMIRRLKADVAEQLPELTRTILPVLIPNMDQYRQVRRAVEEAILSLNPKSKGYFANALDKLNTLRYAVGVGKAEMAIEWASNFLSSTSRKLVIYAHHQDIVARLREGLQDYGVGTIVGGVSLPERRRQILAYQSEATPRVMIISEAGGEGINLYGKGGVESSDILFVEREWTPSREEQAEGRLHRQGQHNAVNAWYLVAKGTVDEKLADAIEGKRATIRSVIDMDEVRTTVVSDVLRDFLGKGV